MASNRMIAHYAHETERNAATQILGTPQMETDSYVIYDQPDDATIKRLEDVPCRPVLCMGRCPSHFEEVASPSIIALRYSEWSRKEGNCAMSNTLKIVEAGI